MGGADLQGAWPVHDRQLSPDEIRQMQTRLKKMGYDVGEIDERDGTAIAAGALVQVLEAGIDRSDQVDANRVELSDALLHLDQLVLSALLQSGVAATTTPDLDQVRHLVEGEACGPRLGDLVLDGSSSLRCQ